MQKTLIFFLLLSNLCFAQSYEQAKNLLDRVSAQMKSKENIRFGFSYVLENKKEQIRQEMEGNVTLSGDRYILNFLEAEQLFDGNKIIKLQFPSSPPDRPLRPCTSINPNANLSNNALTRNIS